MPAWYWIFYTVVMSAVALLVVWVIQDSVREFFSRGFHRPPEPDHNTRVNYRGWEAEYNLDHGMWTGDYWVAFRGGADLDAPAVSAPTWVELLNEIDDWEECYAD